jgi:hypothetical protein
MLFPFGHFQGKNCFFSMMCSGSESLTAPVNNIFSIISAESANYIKHKGQDNADDNTGHDREVEAEVLALEIDIPREPADMLEEGE